MYLNRLSIMALSCGNLAVAKSTGAVARPSCRSAAAGLPGYPELLFIKGAVSRYGYFYFCRSKHFNLYV